MQVTAGVVVNAVGHVSVKEHCVKADVPVVHIPLVIIIV
jgi:hypothetical protein